VGEVLSTRRSRGGRSWERSQARGAHEVVGVGEVLSSGNHKVVGVGEVLRPRRSQGGRSGRDPKRKELTRW
jgi:hypothetical protein